MVLNGVPDDATVDCDAVPAPASVTADDTCDPDPIIDFEEVRTDGSCPDEYTLTRTWTATDDCGNSSADSRTITVQDTTDPIIGECPENIFVECAPSAGMEIEFDTPGVSDNCDGDVTVTADFPSGTVFPTGETPLTTVVTFTAEDNCGHTDSCSFEVTLVSCGACCNFNGSCMDDVRHNTCFDDTPFTPLGRTWFVDSACADSTCQAIPTVSEWGLLVMTLLGCTAGTIIFGRRRRATQAT